VAKRKQQRTSGRANARSGSSTRPTPSRQARRTGGSTAVREQKRAQFTGEAAQRRSRLPLVIAVAATIAVVAVAGAFILTRGGGGGTEFAQAASGAQGNVEIPLAEVSDGNAHFYTYESGGTKVNYFVMQSPDGTVRAAFDACDVCYPYKKGYHQSGTAVQCNNCGRIFDSDKINVLEGGCNPAPLKRTVVGDKLVVSPTDIEAGAHYFL
jgi:uncharacterized membrane protein